MFNKLKYIVLIVFLFSIIPSYIYCIDTDSLYVWSSLSSSITTDTEISSAENSGNFLNITSGSAILIEQQTGKVLYEHNAHDQLRPASVTKIMTILLIMESIDNRPNKFNR